LLPPGLDVTNTHTSLIASVLVGHRAQTWTLQFPAHVCVHLCSAHNLTSQILNEHCRFLPRSLISVSLVQRRSKLFYSSEMKKKYVVRWLFRDPNSRYNVIRMNVKLLHWM